VTAAPALDTERLTLEGHVLADLAESAAMWGDPVVTRHIGGRPSTEEEVWARLLRYVGHWAALGYGYWAVREKRTGRFVGEVGLADFHRDLTPPLDAPEAGWVLAPWAHGQGFATEALGAVLAWAARDPRLAPRQVCLIAPENVASVRVAARHGFVEYARTTYHGEATLLLERRPAPDR
jgi:RimJ/RimL family protein N-acetyltransferase